MTITERPQIIKHNNINYYNASDLKKYDFAYFHGTSAGIRKIIFKKKIKVENYHYATFSKKFGWTSCCHQNDPSTKAKLLLLESWVIANVPKMMPDSDESKSENYEYPEAPRILTLRDYEKFKDVDGNTVDIETRGERTSKGIYFLAKDVSKAFEMPKLLDSINDSRCGYTDDDYKTFATEKTDLRCKIESKRHYNFYSVSPNNGETFATENTGSSGKIESKRQIFITYEGMIKLLYSSRSKIAKTFRTWATETLFTVQMGSEQQKKQLSSKLLGVTTEAIDAVFKKSVSSVPAVYLFTFGFVKDLRESMNIDPSIPDNYIVAKYGRCEDLNIRKSAHIKTYGKIKNVDIRLLYFAMIDPQFVSEAETTISHYYIDTNMKINYENHTEIIAFDPKKTNNIKNQYTLVQNLYAGKYKELILINENLKKDIESKNKEIENIAHNHKLQLKLKDKELELKDKDVKYEQLRNELLMTKLK